MMTVKELAKLRRDNRIQIIRTFTDKRNGYRRVKTFTKEVTKLMALYRSAGVKFEVFYPQRRDERPMRPRSWWGQWPFVVVCVPEDGCAAPRTIRNRRERERCGKA